MRVCLVSPYDFIHPGGVTEHVRHLADELRRRDHEVTILAPSSRVPDDHGIPGYVRIGRSIPVRGNGSVARIALSFHLVRRVRSLLSHSDFDVVHYHEPLVPGGIDSGRFRPDLTPLPELRSDGRVTILFVGRMEQRKGLPILLDAYARLRRERSDCRLVIVGAGPVRWAYERQCEARGVPGVSFLGHVPADLLPHSYARADLFCSPATGGESFGIVLLEAMASGLPVVASAIPGFKQVVAPGADGLLVPPGSAEGFAQAFGSLIANPGERRSMGRRGVEKARRYDWRVVVDGILDVYGKARERAAAGAVAEQR